MIKQKEDTSNYSATILFIVLFCFFAIASSNQTDSQTSNSLQYEFISGFNSSQVSAVIVVAIKLPSAQNSCLDILFNANLNLFNYQNKILLDNRQISQRFTLLQNTLLVIKPILLERFYFFSTPADSKDFPVLS